MIIEAVDVATMEPAAAADPQVVPVDDDAVQAERAEPFGDPRDPVRFLVAELAGATDDGGAVGVRRREAQDRDLVDGCRDVGRPKIDRTKGAGANSKVGDRL